MDSPTGTMSKNVSLAFPVPDTDNPEFISRHFLSRIHELLQRVEWIGGLNNTTAKLQYFDQPIWDSVQRKQAKKLRSIYAHDFERIDRHGAAHFYNKGRKKGPKKTVRMQSQIREDWMAMHLLVYETLVAYVEFTVECQTCGATAHGNHIPDCRHCAPPPNYNPEHSIAVKPAGATLRKRTIFGRSDDIDEFVNDRRKLTITYAGWQAMMETNKFPDITRLELGDNIIPDDEKVDFLRTASPTG